jgi:hypothetical protein
MTTEFTKKGHRLERDATNPAIFRCRSLAVYRPNETLQKNEGHLLAEMLVWPPCTAGQMIATIRAWLGVYDDEELLEQVNDEVRAFFDAVAPLPTPTPSTPPQKSQGQGLN